MTFLHYLGHEGSTNNTQAGFFRMGSGTTEDYRRRAKTAILSLKETYEKWPDANQRKVLGMRHKKKYHCPNAIGNGDGTLTELAFAPQCPDSANYHGRKFKWSLTTCIVGDDEGYVLYHLAGFPGSAHDNRVWKWSKLYQNRKDLFSDFEYILTDSAIEPCENIVCAYKDAEGVLTDPKKAHFNSKMGSPRETSEHIIGWLKGRFPAATCVKSGRSLPRMPTH